MAGPVVRAITHDICNPDPRDCALMERMASYSVGHALGRAAGLEGEAVLSAANRAMAAARSDMRPATPN